MLGHELVELFLVLGVTQTIEEILELVLLVLEAPQRFHAVFVEGSVAAGGRVEAAKTTEAKSAPLHATAHPLHLVLHPLHFILPAILMTPATHARSPEGEKEEGKTDRPPEHETENGRDHHAGVNTHMRAVRFVSGPAPLMNICGVGHFPLRDGDRPL